MQQASKGGGGGDDSNTSSEVRVVEERSVVVISNASDAEDEEEDEDNFASDDEDSNEYGDEENDDEDDDSDGRAEEMKTDSSSRQSDTAIAPPPNLHQIHSDSSNVSLSSSSSLLAKPNGGMGNNKSLSIIEPKAREMINYVLHYSFTKSLNSNSHWVELLYQSFGYIIEYIGIWPKEKITMRNILKALSPIVGQHLITINRKKEEILSIESVIICAFMKSDYCAKSIDLAEFLRRYPDVQSSRGSIGEDEVKKLHEFCNCTRVVQQLIPPKNNKEHILELVSRLTEGFAVRRVTGTGMTVETRNRYDIVHKEGGLVPRPKIDRQVRKQQKELEKISNGGNSLPPYKKSRSNLTMLPPSLSLPPNGIEIFGSTHVQLAGAGGRPGQMFEIRVSGDGNGNGSASEQLQNKYSSDYIHSSFPGGLVDTISNNSISSNEFAKTKNVSSAPFVIEQRMSQKSDDTVLQMNHAPWSQQNIGHGQGQHPISSEHRQHATNPNGANGTNGTNGYKYGMHGESFDISNVVDNLLELSGSNRLGGRRPS